jgi:hypothetical protein
MQRYTMKNDLSSVQRRLLKEQEEEEIELEVPEGEEGEGEEVEPAPPEGEGEESIDEVPLEEPEGEGEVPLDAEEGEGQEKVDLITKTIDSLETTRNELGKKGLLVAMHLSDYSTQRRLEAVGDELGDIIKHLNDKVLKTVAKSPMDVERTTSWLAGEEQ